MTRLLSLVFFVVGCTEVPPPSAATEPLSTKLPKPAVKPARPAPNAPPEPGKPFTLAWTLQTKPFNKGIALSDALVAVLGSRNLAMVEKRTGRLVGERDVCFTFHGAFTFTGEDAAAIVCEQEVQLISVPDLEYRGTRALPGLARMAAFSAGSAAIAFESGPVRVYAVEGWAEAGEVKVDHDVKALALDTRHLAIGLDQGDVILVDRKSGDEHRLHVKTGFSVDALAFSPDGDMLFSGAGPDSSVWNVAERRVLHRIRAVSGVTAASWLGASEIGSVGKDGILVLDLTNETAASMPSNDVLTPISMATSLDANVMCAADRDGKLACYSRGGIPTRAIPSPELAIDEDRMLGRVLGVVGKRLTVKAQPGSPIPRPGVEVRLMRYTESMVGDVRSARWIELLTTPVLIVKKDVVHVDIDGALTPIPGVEDPLTYDTAVRLVWKRKKPKQK